VGTVTGKFEIIDEARLPIYNWARELEPGALASPPDSLLLNPWVGLTSARQTKGGRKRGQPDVAGSSVGPSIWRHQLLPGSSGRLQKRAPPGARVWITDASGIAMLPGYTLHMAIHERNHKKFDSAARDELEAYARTFGIAGTDAMSDTELRKRLRDVQGTTGTAPESDLSLDVRGDPGRGPKQ